MQSAYEKLPVYRKADQLYAYFECIVRNFDRHNKYTIGADLRNFSRRVVVLIAKANTRSNRVECLQEAIDKLEELKVTVRACQTVRAFKKAKSYEHSSKEIVSLLMQCEGWKASFLRQ